MQRCFSFILVVFFTTLAFAQMSIEQFEKLIVDNNLVAVGENLQAFQSSYPSHPAVIYATGLLQKNAEQALPYFHKIVQNAPESTFGDDALLKIGQYYYVKGQFDLARKYFSLLARSYLNSPLRDDAQYLLCQSIAAQGKSDSAKIFLQIFIKNSEQSFYTDLANEDLQYLSTHSADKTVLPVNPSTAVVNNSCFTIQVGAFAEKANAKALSKKLKSLGYPVEIFEKYKDGVKLYLVLVGRFKTRDEATNAAEKHVKDQVQEFRIVERVPIN